MLNGHQILGRFAQMISIAMISAGMVAATEQLSFPSQISKSHHKTIDARDLFFSVDDDASQNPTEFMESKSEQPIRSDSVWNSQRFEYPVSNETVAANRDDDFTPEKLKELLRPNFEFAAELQAETNGIGLTSYDASAIFPTYPWFGPPPPIITIGMGYTNIDASAALGLPNDLYETEFGFAWMRKINDQWMTRFTAGMSFATDQKNRSSDAWQFRGGVFAVHRRNPAWTWAFGAIALGRNDIPVVPAVGLIYQPNPNLRFDFILPKPKISCLLADHGSWQQWGYLGAGLNGGTWGVQRLDGVDDQLTYGDFRAVVGWESKLASKAGMPFPQGPKLGAEIGYVFGRDFEFEYGGTKIRLDDTLMLSLFMKR